MAIDVTQLVEEITNTATQVLNQDVKQLRGFSARQVQAIAQQAAFIEAGILSGQITEETRDFFLDSLEDMALTFVKTLRGLVMVTVEKVWNAIVGVIWKAIESTTGIVLPQPGL
ncbi:hypothetical protein Dvar_80580 [Desulfosarcina variabilis str. Montpellier]|jgi:hypothetical protein|uniref:hypothetical protein n=1 Tax=Desulfosarcina variabilis TaxID=2300 RepID=UPI003AFA346F